MQASFHNHLDHPSFPYRAEIDGLRAIAVLPVIFFHVGLSTFSGGFVGVDVFFVISGYLITSIILKEKAAGGFSLVRFYERRARRILPALFFLILATIPFAWLWILPKEMMDFAHSVGATTLFSSNILFWNEVNYFNTVAAELNPLLHTWSLGVEEQYYILFPLLFSLLLQIPKRGTMISLGLIAVASLSFAQWAAYYDPPTGFYLLPSRMWELLLGSFIAYYLIFRTNHPFKSKVNLGLKQGASIIGLSLIGYAVFFFDAKTPYPSFYTLIPTIGAALVLIFADPTTWVGKFLNFPLLVGVGLISYSAYLWHQPLFVFARYKYLDSLDSGITFSLLLLLALLSYLSWRYIEQPFRKKNGALSKYAFASFFILVSGLLLFSVAGHLTNGFDARFSAEQKQIMAFIKKIKRERQILIFSGQCQYNTTKSTTIQDFLSKWDCKGNGPRDIALKRIPFAITGDSHSSDIAMALRLNGLSPLQLGGVTCSLYPKHFTAPCTAIYERLYEEIHNDSYYEYLVIVNKFEPNELKLDAIKDTIAFWKKYKKKLIFFTEAAKYPYFEESAVRKVRFSPYATISDLSKRAEILEFLQSEGVHVIDTSSIFCAMETNCSPIQKDGIPLLVDTNHLSPTGAKRFGALLLEKDAIFHQWQ